jgi:hypothetical protein
MFAPPIGEQGIWFSNPAAVYRVTSIGIIGKHIWSRVIEDRKNKIEIYGVEELLKICAPSHKVNVYKYICNLELLKFFEEKRAKIMKQCYELLLCFNQMNIPDDVTRYLCEQFFINAI